MPQSHISLEHASPNAEALGDYRVSLRNRALINFATDVLVGGYNLLRCCLALLAGLFLLAAASAPGQNFGAKSFQAKGFKIAEPFPPPYETQIKSLLEGGKAMPLPGGKTLLSDGVTLRTFSETNTPQLVVHVDQCFYNSTNHSVDSAGPIRTETADGKFTIEGEGFFWQQTNSSLVISNKVRTYIQADLLQSASTNRGDNATKSDSGPLFISSGQFSYDGESGRGVWSDSVRVTGTNLVLNSAVLTAVVPVKERQVQSLVADGDVAIDYGKLNATGGHMNYGTGNGLVRLWDHATWHDEQREGRGDELVIDRTNRIFQVNGHAWLKLPGQTLGDSGFLSFSNSAAPKSSRPAQRAVEIVCDNYEIRTNLATFHEPVRLEELLDGAARGRMTCKFMSATFLGTNQLDTILADKDVIIEEFGGASPADDKQFTGGRAFYTHTNTILEMTQNPEWQAGLRRGKGDLVRVNTQRNEMFVRGNASLRLPANELASQLTPTSLSGTTNQPAKAGTNQFAEIFSEEYTLSANTSVFRGGVYATHPEMNWSCEKLTVQLPAAGTTNLVANGNVVFDLMTQKGKVHGTGDDAVYTFGVLNTATNGNLAIHELRLTGTPAALTNATMGAVRNPVIIWDRDKDKFTFPGGDYKFQGFAKAVDTNIFVLPNKKLTK